MWRSDTGWLPAALAAAVAATLVLAIALAHTRRLHRRALERQRWLLEREHQHTTRVAVDAERARIARELHDIVSHNVSLMVVQANAAREVLDTMPREAAGALTAVETAGRDTMTELRHLLGVLAPDQNGEDDDPPLAPQPGLDQLGRLVDRIAFAGLPVEVRISGEPHPLPTGIDVTGYRIVQEALTNALKHGTGGEAEVAIKYTRHHLRVEVLTTGPSVLNGDPATPGTTTGRGLTGLHERVSVYGGVFDARRRLGGGFRVRARIPLRRP
ncbi:histidine kinase [Stackebrandtia albiflava]|uniref:histidine kinase n=1 Tax=Stackebrandtia albiflava TaxID=406432 RepID=A0A562VEU0_9ACTN|nr:histidine kinase [Stackebrandtia albiflava]TWJ16378.1 histidine kinase [Stackebrandtia albiflava]